MGSTLCSSEFRSWASTRTTPNIALVFKVIFTVLADSAKLLVVHVLPLIFPYIRRLFQNLGSTCTPLSIDLGQVKTI